MHRKLALTAILAVVLVVAGYAQRRNFSGNWETDQAATDAANTPAGTAGGRLVTMPTGFPMTITHTADSFIIKRRGNGDGTTIAITYKLDGIEHDVKTSQGTVKAKARWDGDTIVIETRRASQDGTLAATIATYAIDKDGILWVETKTPQATTRRAFKK